MLILKITGLSLQLMGSDVVCDKNELLRAIIIKSYVYSSASDWSDHVLTYKRNMHCLFVP